MVEVSKDSALNIRIVSCDGGCTETFPDESAFGDATCSLVGDTALVDVCTTIVCDSPATELVSIGESEVAEKIIVVIAAEGVDGLVSLSLVRKNTAPIGILA